MAYTEETKKHERVDRSVPERRTEGSAKMPPLKQPVRLRGSVQDVAPGRSGHAVHPSRARQVESAQRRAATPPLPTPPPVPAAPGVEETIAQKVYRLDREIEQMRYDRVLTRPNWEEDERSRGWTSKFTAKINAAVKERQDLIPLFVNTPEGERYRCPPERQPPVRERPHPSFTGGTAPVGAPRGTAPLQAPRITSDRYRGAPSSHWAGSGQSRQWTWEQQQGDDRRQGDGRQGEGRKGDGKRGDGRKGDGRKGDGRRNDEWWNRPW